MNQRDRSICGTSHRVHNIAWYSCERPAPVVPGVLDPEDDRTVVVRLGASSIGDEEVHALVAVLAANDHTHLLDLSGNNITDVGARGLATLLRSSKQLAELDLRRNNITETGTRILAEALEHNNRVRHVFVHGDGRIEALGTISGAVEGGEEDDDDCSPDHRA